MTTDNRMNEQIAGAVVNLDELRKIAEEATPGPWESMGRFIETKEWVECQDGDIVSPEVDCMAYCYGGSARGIGNPSDAEFIAAFNPEVALALIAEVREARDSRDGTTISRLAEVEAERDVLQAKLDKVRTLAYQHRSIEQHNEMTPITQIADLIREPSSAEYLAALDGAPEPEWEWGAMWPDSCIGEPSIWGNREESIRKEIEGNPGMYLVRRRKPDPWLPVEGDSK